jgi:hypothetical protein
MDTSINFMQVISTWDITATNDRSFTLNCTDDEVETVVRVLRRGGFARITIEPHSLGANIPQVVTT